MVHLALYDLSLTVTTLNSCIIFSSLTCPECCCTAMNFAAVRHGSLRVYWKYREDRTSSQRAWLDSTILNLAAHHDSANTLVQFTLISHLDYTLSIWFTPIHSWLMPGFLSVLSICHAWFCQRAISFLITLSQMLLLLLYVQLDHSHYFRLISVMLFSRRAALNSLTTSKPFLYALLAMCAFSSWHFSQ